MIDNICYEEFIASLDHTWPSNDMPAALKALWWDKKGDWDTAHSMAQDANELEGAWVHAYLHRKEGDEFNALYWYSKASKPECTTSLDKEWEFIARELLNC